MELIKTKLVEFENLYLPFLEMICVPLMFWVGKIVSVGKLKLSQVEKMRLPSLFMLRLVELGFPEALEFQTLWPEMSLRVRLPEVVMNRGAEALTGVFSLVDQTVSFIERLWYQIEKV